MSKIIKVVQKLNGSYGIEYNMILEVWDSQQEVILKMTFFRMTKNYWWWLQIIYCTSKTSIVGFFFHF